MSQSSEKKTNKNFKVPGFRLFFQEVKSSWKQRKKIIAWLTIFLIYLGLKAVVFSFVPSPPSTHGSQLVSPGVHSGQYLDQMKGPQYHPPPMQVSWPRELARNGRHRHHWDGTAGLDERKDTRHGKKRGR